MHLTAGEISVLIGAIVSLCGAAAAWLKADAARRHAASADHSAKVAVDSAESGSDQADRLREATKPARRENLMTTYLHTAQGTLDGSFPWSIHAISSSSASESAAETAWAAGMVALFGDATYKTFLPAMTSMTETSTSTADATFHQTTKTSTTHAVVGTSASPAIGFRSCAIVTLRTAQSTRWGRGRWFTPGMATNALATNGYFYSAAATGAFAAAVTGAFNAWNATLQIQIGRRVATKHGPGAFTLTPVNGGDVSDEIATQRRRADKRVPTRTGWTFP